MGNYKEYDVIIVGAGVAGLYAALNLDSSLRILLLSKRELSLSNSSLAQGGVASVMDRTHDTIQSHYEDTLIAGGYKNNPDSTEILVTQGPHEVRRLMDFDVDFDRNEDGSLHLTLEGGHSHHRILHHKDATGKEIVDKLIAAVKKLPNVEILERALVADLRRQNHLFSADILMGDEHTYAVAPFCILATGGIGRAYEYTTNSAIATGDGIALAYRLGAKIKNISLVQFHPTAFADKRCELAPRDVVSTSIILESARTGSKRFYLDISHKDSEFLKNRFPMIYRNLLEQGYDLTRERVPIYPCQHYLMGGVDVDTSARTSVHNLYACGECSHTGVHGGNRLASNSLLEALVFSQRAAENIGNKAIDHTCRFENYYEFEPDAGTEPLPHGMRTEVREIMQHAHFVIPNKEAAKKGYERICEIRESLENGNYRKSFEYCETLNLVTVAALILKEVISR